VSDLTEMWAALERYQPYADKAGHGDSWRRMTTKRTADAAWAARGGTSVALVAAWAEGASLLSVEHMRAGAVQAAVDAAWDALCAAEADRRAAVAIERISKAMEVQP
jgi:hypothetical protein